MTGSRPARRALIELLHPRGRAARALVLGSACPPRLRPDGAPGTDDAREELVAASRVAGRRSRVERGTLDLVVIAPSPGEASRPWLEQAIKRCAASLDADGLGYLLLRRRDRARARRLIRSHGLVLDAPLLHLPEAADTRQVVPLERRAAREAFTRVVRLVGWKRRTLRALFALRADALIAMALPGVALVARRPGARPPLAWIAAHGPPATGARRAVLTTSWSPRASSVVVHPVGEEDVLVVAKLSLDPATPVSREADALSRLGVGAARAGAAVPGPVARFDLDELPVLVETRVSGRPAAFALMKRPRLLEWTLTSVGEWLERWQVDTAREGQLSSDRLERELLAPAELVASRMAGGTAYLAALGERCERLVGRTVPFAPAHNDLTMWNVLLGGEAGLGIVDWAEAEEATLPLKDLFYMAVDAVAAAGRYRDRPAAARACFEVDGRHAQLVGGLRSRIARALGLDSDLIHASFHACWLRHAANEERVARAGDDRPFLAIVQALAATLRA